MKTLWKPTLKLWAFCMVNLPLIFYLRPRIVESDANHVVVRMPLCRRSKNHLRSMYFGALSTGADLAPGILTLNAIEKSGHKVSFVFQDFQASFLKRCESDAIFTCQQGLAIQQAVETSIKTKERQHITVDVIARSLDSLGEEPVAVFKLTLSVKAKE